MDGKICLDLNKFEVNRPKTFFPKYFFDLAAITMKNNYLSWHAG